MSESGLEDPRLKLLLALSMLFILVAALTWSPPLPQLATTVRLGFHTTDLYGQPPASPSSIYPSMFTGAGVRVAVVDSGVDYLHPDLRDSIECMISFVVFQNGHPLIWCPIVNGTLEQAEAYENMVFGSTGQYAWRDENGHGTHVAGIIAGRGIASGGRYRGIAPGAKLWVVKVFNRYGEASEETIVNALRYLAEFGIDIVNLSLGADNASPSLKYAVDILVNSGKIVVAAAGNNGQLPLTVTYPARYENVLAVGAVMRDGKPAPFSSMGGPGMAKPDIAAFGVAVVSTFPTYSVYLSPERVDSYYGVLSGTSMACAVASGILALWVEVVGKQEVRDPNFVRAHSIYMNPFGLKTYPAGWGLLLPP
jgi:subtilisin family serine protease